MSTTPLSATPSAADILASLTGDRTETVTLPEWGEGVSVTVRALSRATMIQVSEQPGGELPAEETMFVAGVIAPRFTAEQFQALARKPGQAGTIGRILETIKRISGMTAQAVAEAEAAF